MGALLVLGGAGVALYCSSLFRRIGLGTPVPIEPPQQLVVSGLYRYSRNPIYVADVAILLGIFLVGGWATQLLYALVVTGLIHALIVLHEEPVLQRRFGEPYARYVQRVPRWLPSRAARTSGILGP